ncbi:MAG: hypothetical protein AB8B85_05690 [Paracoccaceae bacterium]
MRDRWLQPVLRLIQGTAQGFKCGKTGMVARPSGDAEENHDPQAATQC